MLPKIIGLVGPIRAGKSTVGRLLVERYGYRLASNSDILKEIAKNLAMSVDRESLKRIGDAIFTSLGNEAIARFRINNEADFPIVVDGIRYPEEIAVYRQEPSFRLLAVEAGEDVRHRRALALAHEGKDRLDSRTAFISLSSARSERYVQEIAGGADAIIQNEADTDALKARVDAVMAAWCT